MTPADRLAGARRLHARGVAAVDRGKPVVANTLLHRALRAVPQSAVDDRDAAELACRIEITMAWTDCQLHGLDPALQRLERTVLRSAEHDLTAVRTSLQNQRGVLYLYAGRLPDAVQEFDAALPFPADVPALERCKLLLNRGVVHLELGDIATARDDLTRCAALAHDADLPVLELKATHNLGYAEFLAGDLPAALRAMDAAWEMDPNVAPGTALLGKAQVLVEAGLVDAADETLARAEQVFRGDRLARDLAETQLERARCALIAGHPDAARRYAARARDRFRRQRNDHWRRSAELVLLQADLAAGRSPGRLRNDALRLYDDLGSTEAAGSARVAGLIAIEAHLATGATDAALDMLQHVSRAGGGTATITVRMHEQLVRARLAAAAGDRTAARQRVRTALSDLARYQAGFGSTDLSTAAAIHGRRLGALDITLALDTGRPDAVFAAAERARAVTSRFAAVHPPRDPVAAELLTELRQNAQSLREAARDPAQLDQLQRRRAELQRDVLSRSWTVAGGRGSSRPAGLSAVRQRLVELGQTMLMFVQTGATLSVVSVGARVALTRLDPPGAVQELVRRVRSDLDVLAHPGVPVELRRVVLASLRASLARLDDALVTPVATEGPLVLVCTGELGQLPWASLPSLAGRSLTVAPSATKWLRSSSVRSAGDGPPVTAALAGPDLDRAGHEAADVAAAWGGAPAITGASCAEFRTAMECADLVHVAAHGVHESQHPLFSSLRMADGPVFAHELSQLAAPPAHVVLSACEVGRASVRPGDEALGLASALLLLGTTGVVAGVARVGDARTEQVMHGYHRHLAAGTDSAAALSAALADVDDDHVPPFVHFGSPWLATARSAGTMPVVPGR